MDVYSNGSIKTKTLSVLVILTMCLTSCEALPTDAVVHGRQYRNHVKRETVSMHASSSEQMLEDLPWWYHPCNETQSDVPPCARHKPNCQRTKSININLLKSVMNLTLAHFNLMKDTWISKTYQSAKSISKRTQKNWRLKRRYESFINAVGKGQKRDDIIKDMIPKLHTDIQMFGLIFENLQNLEIDTQNSEFEPAKRSTNIANITLQLKSLLCEVELQLKKSNVPIPEHISRDSFTEVFERNWNQAPWIPKPDLTEITSQDSGMFFAYEYFLKDWKKILNDIRQYKKLRHNHSKVSNESTGPNARPRGRRRRNKARTIYRRSK